MAVPTGAINFGEPGTNGTGAPIFFGEDLVRNIYHALILDIHFGFRRLYDEIERIKFGGVK